MEEFHVPTSRDENNIKKGAWTPEEDQQLIGYIQTYGHGRWTSLPKCAGLKRNGKSCRLRWKNYLQPYIKRGEFSMEEENTILHLHSIVGNKWSKIANGLPGRTDNEIKNYWNTRMKKKLIRMGIDPTTHQPRIDLSSCLLQLLTLHDHLARNIQHFTLMLQTITTLSNPVNSIASLEEENPCFVNESPFELNQEGEGIQQFNSGNSSVTQTLQDVLIDVQTDNNHHVMGYDQTRSKCLNSSSFSPVIQPLMDISSNINYVGTSGDTGISYNWLENLITNSILDENYEKLVK